MGRITWALFKGALSALLLLFAVAAAYNAFVEREYIGLLFAALMLIFVGFLWVDWSRPTRALGALGVCFSGGCLAMAYSYFVGHAPLPEVCGGRGWVVCHITNALYATGGRPLVSAMWAVFAVVFFAMAVNGIMKPVRVK